jgi:hypothetical protein
MAKIEGRATCQLHITIALTEDEARALDSLAGYGDDAFVEAFYTNLGRSYMERHEQGLRSFLKSIREFIPGVLGRADDARLAFDGRVDREAINSARCKKPQ